MLRISRAVLSLLPLFAPHLSAEQTGKWGDQGDGTFRNPIIAADFSDPDPLRVGDDYYLASSTFESVPGVTILHSRDLVNWSIIGGVFTDLAKIDAAFTTGRMDRYNQGVYAPSLRHHDGKFWVFVNLFTDGFFVATAKDPAGPWEVRQIKDRNGKPLSTRYWTDPCPFWDADGKAYLASSHPGSKWFGYLFQMTPDGGQLLDADVDHLNTPDIVYDHAKGGGTLISPNFSSEGNKIYRRNGYYYLVHIEFLDGGHGMGTYVYRSKHIYGTKADGTPGGPGDPGAYEWRRIGPPFKEEFRQPIPGQGGLVDTPDGRWFWIAQFNRYGSDGRTPCLLPVRWIDDWPVFGVDPIEDGYGKMAWQLPKPIPSDAITLPQQSDEFASATLAPFWAWNHQPRADKWSLTERPGWLRLHAFATADRTPTFFKVGNTVSQRHMRSESLTVVAKLDLAGMAPGQRAGLANFNGGIACSLIAVVAGEDGARKLFSEINGSARDGPALPAGQTEIFLRSRCTFDDAQTYQYSFDGHAYHDLGDVYRPSSGNFRGNMIGLFTYNNEKEAGHVDVDSFRYEVLNK